MENINYRETEEFRIAMNLPNYKSQELFRFEISKIDQILLYYFTEADRNIDDEKKIISLLFDCLDKFEMNASVLFRHIGYFKDKNYIIEKLFFKYQGKFDFIFVQKELSKLSFELINEKQKIIKIINFCIGMILFLLSFSIIIFYKNNKKANDIDKYILDIKQLEKRNNKIQEMYIKEVAINGNLTNQLNIIHRKLDDEIPLQILHVKEEFLNKLLNQQLSIGKSFVDFIKDEMPKIQDKIQNDINEQNKIGFQNITDHVDSMIEIVKKQTKTEKINITEIKKEILTELSDQKRNDLRSNDFNIQKENIDQIKQDIKKEILIELSNQKRIELRNNNSDFQKENLNQIKEDIKKEILIELSNQKRIDLRNNDFNIQKEKSDQIKQNYTEENFDQVKDNMKKEKLFDIFVVFKIILCIIEIIFEIYCNHFYFDSCELLSVLSAIQTISLYYNVDFIFYSIVFVSIIHYLVYKTEDIKVYKKKMFLFYISYVCFVACIKFYLLIPQVKSQLFYIFITSVFCIDFIFYLTTFNCKDQYDQLFFHILINIYLVNVDISIGFICSIFISMIYLIFSFEPDNNTVFYRFFYSSSVVLQFIYPFIKKYGSELYIIVNCFFTLELLIGLSANVENKKVFYFNMILFYACSTFKIYIIYPIIFIFIIIEIIYMIVSLIDNEIDDETDDETYYKAFAKIWLIVSTILYFKVFIDWLIK